MNKFDDIWNATPPAQEPRKQPGFIGRALGNLANDFWYRPRAFFHALFDRSART